MCFPVVLQQKRRIIAPFCLRSVLALARKPSFRLWPSRFPKVARPPSDLLKHTQKQGGTKLRLDLGVTPLTQTVSHPAYGSEGFQVRVPRSRSPWFISVFSSFRVSSQFVFLRPASPLSSSPSQSLVTSIRLSLLRSSSGIMAFIIFVLCSSANLP